MNLIKTIKNVRNLNECTGSERTRPVPAENCRKGTGAKCDVCQMENEIGKCRVHCDQVGCADGFLKN